MSHDSTDVNPSKDTGIGPDSSHFPVSQWDTPCHSRLNGLIALPAADELDLFLSNSQQAMRDLMAEYTNTFTRPIVMLTIQIAAGVFALRWRAAGTQRYVPLTDPEVCAQLLDEQSRQRRQIRIGRFEQKRLILNHDYAVAFHLRKRARMLNEALLANTVSGLL